MASTSNATNTQDNVTEEAQTEAKLPVNLMQVTQIVAPIPEATMIRLYNSVVVTGQATNGASLFKPIIPASTSFYEQKSVSSFTSAEVGICRICRWNRSDMDVLACPCECKGTVGYIHLQCLKRWVLLRRNSRCEICNASFKIPEEHFNAKRMFISFFTMRYCGAILRNILYCTSLLPLAHVILQQVLTCMERLNVNPTDPISAKEVFLGTFALLTSSAVFFHFFEFITTRLLHCRHILRHWWFFGNTADSQYELDVIPSEFF